MEVSAQQLIARCAFLCLLWNALVNIAGIVGGVDVEVVLNNGDVLCCFVICCALFQCEIYCVHM